MFEIRPIIDGEMEKEYYHAVTDNHHYIDNVELVCKRHFSMSFQQIVLLRPEMLMHFVDSFDRLSESVKSSVLKEFREISTVRNRKTNYIVNRLYGDMPQKARHKIYKISGSRVCPYCNRNYIDVIKATDDSFHSTIELDHFFNKADYPMLAVSLYNLIPVCPACNRLKGKKIFRYYPYMVNDSDHDQVKFSFDMINASLNDENDFDIIIRYRNQLIKDDKQSLYLQELYRNHKDIALEIIKKARYQGEGYMSGLVTQLSKLFPDKAEIYRLIYGNYLNENDWNKRPLSKFTYDIAKETLNAYGIGIDETFRS